MQGIRHHRRVTHTTRVVTAKTKPSLRARALHFGKIMIRVSIMIIIFHLVFTALEHHKLSPDHFGHDFEFYIGSFIDWCLVGWGVDGVS